MPNNYLTKSVVGAHFLKPLAGFLDRCRSQRDCPALPDELWLEVGIRRCLGRRLALLIEVLA